VRIPGPSFNHSGWAKGVRSEAEEATGADRVEPVPRYFFHTEDGRSFHDGDGTILAGVDDARIEAARVLGQLVNEHPADIWHEEPFRMTVTDEGGLVVFVLDIAAVVSPAAARPQPAPKGDGSA
jgi:hypothetical protein